MISYRLAFLCCVVIKTKIILKMHLPIFLRVASLALGQSYDCLSASEATMNYINNTRWRLCATDQFKTKRQKAECDILIRGYPHASIYVIQHGDVTFPLQWRNNESDGVWYHQRLHCLLNCRFRRRSNKTSKLRVTGLCEGNSPMAGEFPTRKASNAENVSIWWRHHVLHICG